MKIVRAMGKGGGVSDGVSLKLRWLGYVGVDARKGAARKREGV